MENCILITQTFLRLYMRKMFYSVCNDQGHRRLGSARLLLSRLCHWLNKHKMFSPDLKFPHHISIIDVVCLRKSSSLFQAPRYVGPEKARRRKIKREETVDSRDDGASLSLPFPLFRPVNFSRAFYFRVFPTIWEPGTGYKSSSIRGFVQFHDHPLANSRWPKSLRTLHTYEIWFRHVTSRFPFCFASIFVTKQIEKSLELWNTLVTWKAAMTHVPSGINDLRAS